MITVFIGQPHSGKTTLAQKMQHDAMSSVHWIPIVDGDDVRKVFKNNDYSREGRIKNLNRISDIAAFLHYKHEEVIVSAVYPYKEARAYLESLDIKVMWVYLTYDEPRGRESFHVPDFEIPQEEVKNLIIINTSKYSIHETYNKVQSFRWSLSSPTRRS